MESLAVILESPERLTVKRVALTPPDEADAVVAIAYSGISTGTERLLWSGRMPDFPGMGYPLVPGYESVGIVREAGAESGLAAGDCVFVPGARCFGEVRGLFGGSASTLVVPGARVVPLDAQIGEKGVLMGLAATAVPAVAGDSHHGRIVPPELIVGHGVLGRLLARMTVVAGFAPPTVWELNPGRMSGAAGYPVLRPEDDPRRDYRAIYDVSGDASILDSLVARLAHGGE